MDRLVAGAMGQLLEHGVHEEDIIIRDVPGCWELPFAVQGYVQVSSLQPVSTCKFFVGVVGGGTSSTTVLLPLGSLLPPNLASSGRWKSARFCLTLSSASVPSSDHDRL